MYFEHDATLAGKTVGELTLNGQITRYIDRNDRIVDMGADSFVEAVDRFGRRKVIRIPESVRPPIGKAADTCEHCGGSDPFCLWSDL